MVLGRRAALQREIKRLEQQDANALEAPLAPETQISKHFFLEASKQLNAEVIKFEEAKKATRKSCGAIPSRFRRHQQLSAGIAQKTSSRFY